MSFLKGLLKYAPTALSLAAPFFPPLAAAAPAIQAAAGAGTAAMAAGGGGGQPPPQEAPPPITSQPVDSGPAPRAVPGAAMGGGQPHQPDLGAFDWRGALAHPGKLTGSPFPGLLGGLAGHYLKKLF